MNERALLVPRARGEEVRRRLVEAGALRTDLEILHEGDRLAFPLAAGAAPDAGWGTIERREFPEREVDGVAAFRDLLAWPAEELDRLPRSFDIVGDIVLVRLPPELEPRRHEVGEALLRFVPGSRLVGLDRGVHGPERRRAVERIAGEGGWATRHRENGLEIDVDLERAYFSPRLAHEHARVAASVRAGERVYDLCCGVGPFSLTIARDGRAREVVAVDANPVAVELLRSSLGRYRFATPVSVLEGRIEEFVATAGPAELVVVNLPHEGIKCATLVAPTVSPGGRLTFYEVLARDDLPTRGVTVETTLRPLGPWAVADVHLVHPYSPSSDLVAVTAVRGGG